jgi:hypothetical protein
MAIKAVEPGSRLPSRVKRRVSRIAKLMLSDQQVLREMKLPGALAFV